MADLLVPFNPVVKLRYPLLLSAIIVIIFVVDNENISNGFDFDS